jgi:hypothetical protein
VSCAYKYWTVFLYCSRIHVITKVSFGNYCLSRQRYNHILNIVLKINMWMVSFILDISIFNVMHFTSFHVIFCYLCNIMFISFVRSSLNPRGDNASADEGYLIFNIIVLPCSWFIAFENKSPTRFKRWSIVLNSLYSKFLATVWWKKVVLQP